MRSITVKAPAKINLGLQVLSKRPDGFHDINTVFVRTSLCDELHFYEDNSISLECEPDLGIRPTENLVYRAAVLLKDYATNQNLFKNSQKETQTGAKIRVRKHIPSGAGLGGGSSDAAATLLALKELWQIDISQYELHTLAGMLGSDVPFFLKDQAAVGLGRGEKLEYFDYVIPYYLLIVYPNIHVNTGEAYSALAKTHVPARPRDFKKVLMESFLQPEVLKENITNDFEEVVFKKHPGIAEIKERLYKSGAVFALMSGSGSSVYGLFKHPDEARIAADIFKNYQTFVCEPQQ